MEGEREPLLDPGIRGAVLAMRAAGIDTFGSCQGGKGHPFPEPCVRWREGDPEVAVRAAAGAGYRIREVREVRYADENILRPRAFWEVIFDGLPEDEG